MLEPVGVLSSVLADHSTITSLRLTNETFKALMTTNPALRMPRLLTLHLHYPEISSLSFLPLAFPSLQLLHIVSWSRHSLPQRNNFFDLMDHILKSKICFPSKIYICKKIEAKDQEVIKNQIEKKYPREVYIERRVVELNTSAFSVEVVTGRRISCDVRSSCRCTYCSW